MKGKVKISGMTVDLKDSSIARKEDIEAIAEMELNNWDKMNELKANIDVLESMFREAFKPKPSLGQKIKGVLNKRLW